MSWDLSQFHFIRPLWLIALPLLALLWFFIGRSMQHTHWQHYIAKNMLDVLRVNNQTQQSTLWRRLLLLGWSIMVIALAGPTWQKTATPTLQNKSALVILLDLSRSMLAKDLTPDRLTQAKYKLIDILQQRTDGQTALVVYAGGAHTVSPLTDDPAAIETLLPALHPNIMPSPGSNVEAAIKLATQLLRDAHRSTGQLLLLTDGITNDAQQTVRNQLSKAYTLSIVGIGGIEPTPIPSKNGGFLRDSDNQIILTSLDNTQLRQLAHHSQGRYTQLTIDDSDITHVLHNDFLQINNTTSQTSYDQWQDMSHWFVLLLLPFAAYCFRKGVLYILPLMLVWPPDSHALTWDNLWLTPDQQATKLMQQQQNQQAGEKFQQNDWSGVAHYRAGNFAVAATKFAAFDNATNAYNQGNALALQGQLEHAIAAYQHAISLQPDHQDAIYNKTILEKRLQQQKNQQAEQKQSAQQNTDPSQPQKQESDTTDSEQSSASNDETSTDNSEHTSHSPSPSDKMNTTPQADEQSGSNETPQSDKEPESNQQPSTQQANSKQKEDVSPQGNPLPNNKEALTQTPPEQTREQQPSDTQVMSTQLKESSEQWLRSIEDDPSGLLRRKFEYQAKQRAKQRYNIQQKPRNERY